MVSQPACPFTYARGEETSLLRGGDWKEEKRKEERGKYWKSEDSLQKSTVRIL